LVIYTKGFAFRRLLISDLLRLIHQFLSFA
jgi:hypothetical protein